jgi:hypothetical protein
VAGWACALGLDGWRLLETGDPVVRLAMIALTRQAAKARRVLDDALIGRLFGGGGDVGE